MRNKELAIELGKFIRTIRERAGYGREPFADDIGIHRVHLGRIENGLSAVSFENVESICRVLRLSLTEFCDLFENPQKIETHVFKVRKKKPTE
jgi:transcriptional regulator with XRE-family HTH domain